MSARRISRRPKAPLIGITCEAVDKGRDFAQYDLLCDHRYAEVVRNAGGHPVLLPIAHHKKSLQRYLEGIDGLVIVGGDDVDPRLFGQEPGPQTTVAFPRRTSFETWLYQAGLRRRLPVMAICYGMQLLNVLEGGTLVQDLPIPRRKRALDHRGERAKAHTVRVIEGTRLHALLGVTRAVVTSQHHQAVDRLAPEFIATAVSADGTIEAIEHPDRPEIIAVQWHPERRLHSRITQRLFAAFMRACRAFRDGRGE